MTCTRRTVFMLCVVGTVLTPAATRAQNSSIAVTATVLPRPLTLQGAMRTGVPGELLVGLAGCGTGAITIDARNATATRRASRLVLDGSSGCAARAVTVRLPSDPDAVSYLVTLQQSNALISPVFAQILIPAAASGPRASLAYQGRTCDGSAVSVIDGTRTVLPSSDDTSNTVCVTAVR